MTENDALNCVALWRDRCKRMQLQRIRWDRVTLLISFCFCNHACENACWIIYHFYLYFHNLLNIDMEEFSLWYKRCQWLVLHFVATPVFCFYMYVLCFRLDCEWVHSLSFSLSSLVLLVFKKCFPGSSIIVNDSFSVLLWRWFLLFCFYNALSMHRSTQTNVAFALHGLLLLFI